MDGYRGRDVELDRMRRRKASNEPKASNRIQGDLGEDRSNGVGNGRKSNGFVNGFSRNGRINGLTNGLTNGIRNAKIGLYNGLVNGLERKTGLINGNGFINGFRLTTLPRKLPLHRRKPGVRIAATLALSAIVIIVPFLLIFSMPTSAILIDGYFFDWDRAGYLIEDVSTANAMIDIKEYSMVRWNDVIYGYIATEGNTFLQENTTPVGFYAMIDLDNNPDTGYIADDIGADRMIEIIGWNGSAQQSQSYTFVDNGNRSDFNSFVVESVVDVANSGNKVEFSFIENTGSDPIIRFFSKSCMGCQDASQYAIKYNHPAIRATTLLTMSDVILPSLREEVMEISLEAKRGSVQLSELRFQQLGNATDYRLMLYDSNGLIAQSTTDTIQVVPSVTIWESYVKKLHLYVTVEDGQNTSSFGLSLIAGNMTLNNEPVVVEEKQTGSKVAYIGEIPNRVVIDGAFADWVNGYVTIDIVGDVRFINSTIGNDPAIDITEYGLYSNGTDVAMYLAVAGNIANGTYLPKDIALPVPSSGLPPIESPELLGADIAGVILDTDLNASTGANATNMMGADYLVFIAGKKGQILSSDLFRWEGGQIDGEWASAGTVQFGIDSRRMEFAFNLSIINLGDMDIAAVAFFMTDWKEGIDLSDSILPLAKWQADLFSRAFGGIIINEVHDVRDRIDWVEIYNTGTIPISMSGWALFDGNGLIFTFPDITINPGEFYVIYNLDFDKKTDLTLVDNLGQIQDKVKAVESKAPRSWGRVGGPPYDKWAWMNPTPGGLNPGQIAIPEFSSIMIPILAAAGFFVIARIRRRKVNNGKS